MDLDRSFRITPTGWVLLLILSILLVWQVPYWETNHLRETVQPERLQQLINDIRATWAQILGGISVLAGLYFAYRRLAVADQNAQIAQRHAKMEGDRQVTHRFSQAIDQLGSESLEIRLGAIYSLERIAEDSSRDYSTVLEVLSAYLRENAPISLSDEADSVESDRRSADLQAALDVLGRLSSGNGSRSRSRWLDLSKSDLHHLDFGGFNFGTTKFNECRLDQARFHKSKLSSSEFSKATIRNSTFRHANIRNATFKAADLSNADLRDVNAYRTSFSRTSLGGANLSAGRFEEAFFRRARFEAGRLRGSNLDGANLRQAVLFETDMSKSSFAHADLRKAKLGSAALGGTSFVRADMRKVEMTNAFVAGADLTQADLRGALLSGLRRWEDIERLSYANLSGVQDPPDGFVQWALEEMGAVRD